MAGISRKDTPATAAWRAGGFLASAVRPAAAVRPPAERSVLDDLAARRPWNLRVKWARSQARRRVHRLVEGVTVVVVSWNTAEVTADTLRAVRTFSPQAHVLVVDNGSSDGSREMLSGWAGVGLLALRSNAGHGVALDLGVCAVRTRVAVTLDSDAIPLRAGWLDPVTEPVLAGRATLAGVRSSRGFVHPMYLAVDVRTFVTRRLSFQVHRLPGVRTAGERWGIDAWDTGELMTACLEPDEVAFVERTANPADGLPGMTAGGVVYHHGGVSRSADGGLSAEALAGWRAACQALGLPGELGSAAGACS